MEKLKLALDDYFLGQIREMPRKKKKTIKEVQNTRTTDI